MITLSLLLILNVEASSLHRHSSSFRCAFTVCSAVISQEKFSLKMRSKEKLSKFSFEMKCTKTFHVLWNGNGERQVLFNYLQLCILLHFIFESRNLLHFHGILNSRDSLSWVVSFLCHSNEQRESKKGNIF